MIAVVLASACFASEDEYLFFSKEQRDSVHDYCQKETEIMSMTLYVRYTKNVSLSEAVRSAADSEMPAHLKIKTINIVNNAYKFDFPKEEYKQVVADNVGANMQYTFCIKDKYKMYF